MWRCAPLALLLPLWGVSHAFLILEVGGPPLVVTGVEWGRGRHGGEGRGGLAPLLFLEGGLPVPRMAGVGWGRGWGEGGGGVAPLSAKDAAIACCISCWNLESSSSDRD